MRSHVKWHDPAKKTRKKSGQNDGRDFESIHNKENKHLHLHVSAQHCVNNFQI